MSRPPNGQGMRQNSSPRLVLDFEKQGSKVSSLKWLRKRPKFRGIPCLVLEKAEEKGRIPRLVSSSTSKKFYQRSRPRPRPRQMTPREPLGQALIPLTTSLRVGFWSIVPDSSPQMNPRFLVCKADVNLGKKNVGKASEAPQVHLLHCLSS